MITVNDRLFKLDAGNTSYVFCITDRGHPEHIYYGSRVPDHDFTAMRIKQNIMLGSTVAYDAADPAYSLDTMLLEYSGTGKGDYRHTPCELELPDGSFVTDFVYESHTITDQALPSDGSLPFASGNGESLTVTMKDKKFPQLKLLLHYVVFDDCNVIVRHTELQNHGGNTIAVRKLMSAMLDLPECEYRMVTLDGGWIKEAHEHEHDLTSGIHVNDSTVGASSNRHNPAFLLKHSDAGEFHGEVLGFNLIYSGNHYSAVECCNHGTLRVMTGINPHGFRWMLQPGERFVTPQAVMTHSMNGLNGMSQNMHRFVNEHIIPAPFRYRERPVVLNNWEATFFEFNKAKILNLARKAKDLGIEMFVLDDGWFGARNSDTAGLGDWKVNEKKLPGGISALSKEIHNMGMQFGLWFEPECINEDSDLYRTHPDWIIRVPERAPGYGRNQLVLDLTRQDVRDYIVGAVDNILSSAPIEYVKWDYNRHISDPYSLSLSNQGEFFHRYILGLYEVKRRIFSELHPDVLLEGCSSGGNRFDLGMLCFAPQIWTSDNTDPIERLDIQGGTYRFYPPSCVSCHVSMAPHQQTLRNTPLSTRFNVAAFGVLGYELDFGELSPEECKQIKAQIAFYKAHRQTCQFGTLYRTRQKAGQQEIWQLYGEKEILSVLCNRSYHASPSRDTLRFPAAKPETWYQVTSVPQALRISRFGGLIKHVAPISLKADGLILRTVDKLYSMTDGQEEYICSGEMLQSGIQLSMQYSGTGYDPSLRILGDWGSSLYLITKQERKDEPNG